MENDYMNDYFNKSYEVLKYRNERLAEKNKELYQQNRELKKEIEQFKSAVIIETTKFNNQILKFLNN